MQAKNRTSWQLVEEQLVKWNASMSERKGEQAKPGPCITISRQAGCGATNIAKKLATTLNMDLMGGKIIQMVAESAEMSDKVVCTLDEKEITRRDDWLAALFESRHLWPDQYLHHLTKVIGTIGSHGNAVIVGRGATFVLPPKDTFSVRIIAPEEIRIKNVLKTTPSEAKRYIIKTDSNRRAFVRKYFNADIEDPSAYDLVINMRGLKTDGAVETIIAAFKAWKR
ncbi:MAG: Cytidylate kinase [Syntrophus sp. SKADARSKE-3]|nr:Cytidylate kinase [Syntrophus sp. SKADARSKE-3]